MKILVTGGAGFIGSALIRYLLTNTEHTVINVDKLTYAGNLASLEGYSNSERYCLEIADICSSREMNKIFEKYSPQGIMHLAAESHVDRSIDNPATFIKTNVSGTLNLLEQTRRYISKAENSIRNDFKFHHISTDEVFGDLSPSQNAFTEQSPYDPSSPYSASKASADHLVRAWGRTYDIPFVISNTSNNYGPFHFPEKFIPHMIICALKGKPLPIYGNGKQIRDWLYVDDHAEALVSVFERGKTFSTYNIGGNNQITNLEVVERICTLIEEFRPYKDSYTKEYINLIEFVEDRPGHDKRYEIDSSLIKRELGWTPKESFDTGLRKTVRWYLDNEGWWKSILDGNYNLKRAGKNQ